MKTITYNPETHVLVPREPTRDMVIAGTHQRFRDSYDAEEDCYRAMIAAAPQPEPVESEPVGWYDGETGWLGKRKGGEHWQPVFTHPPADNKPVDVEPYVYMEWHDDHCEWVLASSYHPDKEQKPLYTTPQPGRTADLEAALKVARDALQFYSNPHVAGQPATAKKALAKINEVLKP